MINPLILLHATLAEIGLIAFLWILVELLNPTAARIERAQIASLVGLGALLLAWFAGGLYYVEAYGLHVKPLIKASEAKWAHSIIMEVKEHVFLFLPVLSLLTTILLYKFENELIHHDVARKTIILLSGLIFLLGFSIAGMGALVSAGYRVALGAGVA